MKYRLLILMLMVHSVLYAQFTIQNVYNEDRTYVFPVFQSVSRPDIAEKINNTIQVKFVEHPNPNAKNPFGTVDNEDEYRYEIGANNSRVLSLSITGAHSGMGYHVSNYDFNFDSHTGNPIDFNKVMGVEGQTRLRKALYKVWKESIKPNLNDSNFADEYKECLANAEQITELDIRRMLITDNTIRVWGGSCLDGTELREDQTAVPRDFSFGQLLPMLTNYGFSLFVRQPASGPFQILLRGTVDNKYPISLVLFPDQGDAIKGQIVYDRFGTPINVKGTMTRNNLLFNELDEQGLPISEIKAIWVGSMLSGIFTNLKTKKQMTFLASPHN